MQVSSWWQRPRAGSPSSSGGDWPRSTAGPRNSSTRPRWRTGRQQGRAPDENSAADDQRGLRPTASTFTGGGTAIGSDAMPKRSPGDVRAGTIRDLGLPGRAVTALTRAGVTRIDELAVLTRRDLAAINGLGAGMIAAIRLVVPEPSTSAPRPGASPDVGHRELTLPVSDPEPPPVEE